MNIFLSSHSDYLSISFVVCMHRHTLIYLYILLNLSYATSFTTHTLHCLLFIEKAYKLDIFRLNFMATFTKLCVTFSILVSLFACSINAQLSPNFYGRTCPSLQSIVRTQMIKAINNEARIGASILRLFFHDCFVNVCLL
jgi:hypothetical protein